MHIRKYYPVMVCLLLIAMGCSPIRRAERSDRVEVRELYWSYMETVWNPENNRPGEQDSIILLIRKEARK